MLIEKIISDHTACFFISPHLDDAIFSAGSVMSQLSGKVPLTVINVFTKASDEGNTLSARKYLQLCNTENSQKLYFKRIAEDAEAMAKIGASVVNLGFTDALWRQNKYLPDWIKPIGRYVPEISTLYPTYRYHIIQGKLHPFDHEVLEDLKKSLRSLTQKYNPNYAVFCDSFILIVLS